MTNNVRLPILAVLAVFMVSLVAIAPQQEVGAQGASWECEPGFYQVIEGQFADYEVLFEIFAYDGAGGLEHAECNRQVEGWADFFDVGGGEVYQCV